MFQNHQRIVVRLGESAMIVEWLEAAMKAAGITKRKALAELAGLTEDQMSKVFRGVRRLSGDEMMRIAEATGHPTTTQPDIQIDSENIDALVSIPKAHDQASELPVTYVTVRGEVAAGTWREVAYDYFEGYDTGYVHDTRWPRGSVFGLVVRGESVNRIAKDGEVAIVLRLDAAPRSFREDDMVIVERSRDGLIETTVKRVRRNNGNGWELWPESTDPAHQQPLALRTRDHDTIRVIGFVLDFIKPVTRFGTR